MLNLNTCGLDAVDSFGLNLLTTNRTKLHSFEEASKVCVKTIFDEFRQQDHQPTFALGRIYRLCRYEELLPELQALAAADILYWMALMGTVGIEPVWCDRRTSQGHKVLRTVGDRSPMLSAAFEQIGLERLTDRPTANPDALPMREASLMTHFFHVPQAAGSPMGTQIAP